MPFMAIDFEASCLPQYGQSYPVELGLAAPDGRSWSWLIRPHSCWQGWQWAEEAEALHGLSREKLACEGVPAEDVAEQFLAIAGQCRLVADSRCDQLWLKILFAAAGRVDVPHLHSLPDLPAFHALDRDDLVEALAFADLRRSQRHRAEDDARWLALLLVRLGFSDASFPPPGGWRDAA